MKSIFAGLLSIATTGLFCGLREPDPPLSCQLRTARTTYRLGEVPQYEVIIRNNARKETYLIGALDGSELKWRMPHCYFTIAKPVPDTVRVARCGNMDRLTKGDFVAVSAGGAFNPYAGRATHGFLDYQLQDPHNFKYPGTYKLQFHYSTASANIDDYLGDGRWDEDKKERRVLKKLLAKVPKVEIVSNEIEVRFDP